MSLRDQLLKAGLVSKKDARRAEQERRRQEQKRRGRQEKKKVREAREAARRAAEERERVEALARARREHARVARLHERALRIRQLIRAHELKAGGPVRYFHRGVGGAIHAMQVSAGTARLLARGRVAVVALDLGTRIRYALVPDRVAAQLAELSDKVVVHWVRDGGEGEEEAAPARDWAPDLRARRATPEDIARFRAAARGAGRSG